MDTSISLAIEEPCPQHGLRSSQTPSFLVPPSTFLLFSAVSYSIDCRSVGTFRWCSREKMDQNIYLMEIRQTTRIKKIWRVDEQTTEPSIILLDINKRLKANLELKCNILNTEPSSSYRPVKLINLTYHWIENKQARVVILLACSTDSGALSQIVDRQ